MTLASIGNAISTKYHQAEPYVSAVLSWTGRKICVLTTMGCDGVSALASKIDHTFAPRIRGWETTVSWAKNHKFTVGIIVGVVLCKVWARFCHKKETPRPSPLRPTV